MRAGSSNLYEFGDRLYTIFNGVMYNWEHWFYALLAGVLALPLKSNVTSTVVDPR